MPGVWHHASQFNDPGTNSLYKAIIEMLNTKASAGFESSFTITGEMSEKIFIIPPKSTRYLSEISESHRIHREQISAQIEVADKCMPCNVLLRPWKIKSSKTNCKAMTALRRILTHTLGKASALGANRKAL